MPGIAGSLKMLYPRPNGKKREDNYLYKDICS